jgi:acetyltransferase-like isoleucine patch superfamily enzyme
LVFRIQFSFLSAKQDLKTRLVSAALISHSLVKGSIKSRTEIVTVEIGNNVWLGLVVVVLKGASVGNNSAIGARSLVAGHIPENVIAAGNPCRTIGPLMS